MDFSSWISLVDRVWNAGDESDPFDRATLKALRHMNMLALNAQKSARELILMSSLPLSYLLHNRNNRGFTCYLSAGLTGHYETDCMVLP